MTDPTKGKADIAALHRMIDEMAVAIDPIVATHAESEKLHADKRKAFVELVTKMLELVQPTVRALGTRPAVSHSFTYDGGSGTEGLADWRGLMLTGTPDKDAPLGHPGGTLPQSVVEYSAAANVGKTNDGTTDFLIGTYGGRDVFLREDGRLVQLSYEGAWRKEPDHIGEWTATEKEISVETFCRDEEYRRYVAEPKALATRLLGFMEAAGNRKKSMAKAAAAAAKFRAITALL